MTRSSAPAPLRQANGSGPRTRNVAIVQNVTPNHHHAVYIDGFARHLPGLGYRPLVVLQDTDEPLQFGAPPYDLLLLGGKYKSIMGQAAFARNLWPALRGLNQLTPLDVIHTMNPFGPLAASLAWRAAQPPDQRPKIIYDIRGLWVELGSQLRFFPPILSSAVDWTDIRLAQGADLVIAITDELKRVLQSKGVPAERIEVVPGGVDLDKFKVPRPFDYAAEWGWNGPVIGYVSSIGRGRNSDVIIKAFRRVVDRLDYPVYLLMIGPTRQPEYFEQLIRDLDLGDRVRMPGFMPHDQLPPYVAGFDVAVSIYPPGQQPFDRVRQPYKVIEYMGAGVPILACDNVCHTAILRNGEDALLVSPYEEDIANGLILLLQNPQLRERLKTQARQAAARFAFPRIAERVSQVYACALETRP